MRSNESRARLRLASRTSAVPTPSRAASRRPSASRIASAIPSAVIAKIRGSNRSPPSSAYRRCRPARSARSTRACASPTAEPLAGDAGRADPVEHRLRQRVRQPAEVGLRERELLAAALEDDGARPHARVDALARDEALRVEVRVGVGDDLERVLQVRRVRDLRPRGVGEHRRADRRRDVRDPGARAQRGPGGLRRRRRRGGAEEQCNDDNRGDPCATHGHCNARRARNWRRDGSVRRLRAARLRHAAVDRGLAHGLGDGVVHVAVQHVGDELGLEVSPASAHAAARFISTLIALAPGEQRALEDPRVAEHVVDARPVGGERRAGGQRVLGLDLRRRVGQREDDLAGRGPSRGVISPGTPAGGDDDVGLAP